VQPGGGGSPPACEIEIACEATVSDAVRDAVPSLASTVNETDPLPVCVSPPTRSQSTWLEADQAHALPVVTLAVPLPPLDPKAVVGADTENAQVGEVGVVG
jgi:hypothetical protein